MDEPSTEPATRAPARRVGRPAQPTDVPTESDILARGLTAFAELGYDGASVRELARRMGVSHNFLNDRYGSKERFWRAVIDRSLANEVERLRAVLSATGEDDLEHLRNLVHAFHQQNVAEPDLARIMRSESMRGGDRLEYVFQRYLVPVRDAVAPLVKRLVAQGRVRPIPIDVMVYAVVAMTWVHAEKPFASLLGNSFETDPSGFARMLSEILLDGLVIQPER